MNSFAVRCLFSLGFAVAWATGTRAAEPAIIAKARAYIATEEVLNKLKSLHYVGTLVAPDPANPGQKMSMSMDIVFQRPNQQRVISSSPKAIETTGLDGYDAWERTEPQGDPAKNRQRVLGPEQIKRLWANTWENLAFFRGIEGVGGRMEEQGTAKIDGIACQKIAFIHAPNIIFYRYFDATTGRLVQTETEAGGKIREEGEMIIEGIRFPRVLITTSKDATQTVTISFEKITVNEVFSPFYFAVPAFGAK